MGGQPSGRCEPDGPVPSWREEEDMPQVAIDLGATLTDAVEAAAPSVVRIGTPHRIAATGLVWDDRGTVLTSHRLVTASRGDLEVVGADGARREPELIGGDRATDVAVLRVDPADLPPIPRHVADDARVGQPVLALGRPGTAVRASLRILGLVARDVAVPGGRLERYLESDRGFPRGFAGGPLVDLAGAALGMNTPYAVRGADLTIPVETLGRLVDSILAHGVARRGYLGVAVQRVRLPRDAAGAAGQDSGALVVAVDEGSPAEDGGLLLGDTLVGLGGRQVDGPDAVRQGLLDQGGQRVLARVLRAGALVDLELAVGQRGGA
jgi:S1-C subfamily serine protease